MTEQEYKEALARVHLDFDEWVKHPCTKSMLEHMGREYEAVKDELVSKPSERLAGRASLLRELSCSTYLRTVRTRMCDAISIQWNNDTIQAELLRRAELPEEPTEKPRKRFAWQGVIGSKS